MRSYWYGTWGGLLIGDAVEIIFNPQMIMFGASFSARLVCIAFGPVEFQWWRIPPRSS